jgi:hypothetical protein
MHHPAGRSSPNAEFIFYNFLIAIQCCLNSGSVMGELAHGKYAGSIAEFLIADQDDPRSLA